MRRHLADGGEFWFDLSLPDVADIAASLGLERAGGNHHDPERDVTLWHTAWYRDIDPTTGTAEFTHRIQEVAGDGTTRTWHREHTVHLFTPPELQHLLPAPGCACCSASATSPAPSWRLGAERQIHRCGVA
ncbi:MAG: hypothetical protein U0Y82_06810 [Thermoleophilia bacterium]